MRLAEVGASGQERLISGEARVQAAGFAGEVEARYLAGAGVGTILASDPGQACAPLPPELAALDPSAREMAEGAYRALLTLREILGT